jgi:protein-tyrosine-phosphatase
MVSILIVCENNNWRSPVFEGLMQELTTGRTDIQFSSAGAGVFDHPRVLKNGLTSAHLETFGVHMPPPEAHGLSPERAGAADLIICVADYLVESIRITPTYSDCKGKVLSIEPLRLYAPEGQRDKLKEYYDDLWAGNGDFQPVRRKNPRALLEAGGYRDARDGYLSAAVGLLAVIDGKVKPTEPELISLQAKMGITPSQDAPAITAVPSPEASFSASQPSKPGSRGRLTEPGITVAPKRQRISRANRNPEKA